MLDLSICGVVLIIDAWSSMVFVDDKRFWWQIGRIVRLLIGIYLFAKGVRYGV
jgi:hypothetical protein